MIKLNIQMFGGSKGRGAKQHDKTDSNPSDGHLDIKIGNTEYRFPNKLFDDLGTEDAAGGHAQRAHMALLYAAFHVQTGETLTSVVNSTGGSVVERRERMKSTLTKWMHEQGETSFVFPEGYDVSNFAILNNSKRSYTEGISTAKQAGAIQIGGEAYNVWANRQERFQHNYIEGKGVPVGKNGNGDYIYNVNGNYTTAEGDVITSFSGAVDMNDRPVVFDTETASLIDQDTKVPITRAGDSLSARENLFNQYYNNLNHKNEGSLGSDILKNNEALYEKEANNAAIIANTSVQSQAMGQAQNIKAVTDALRSERLAQLRAGMSEAQLADRELQMLMSGSEQLNTQGVMARQEALTARLAGTTAREVAFNDYIAQRTALGQNAAANYASQAGDLFAQAQIYMNEQHTLGNNISLDQAMKTMQGKP